MNTEILKQFSIEKLEMLIEKNKDKNLKITQKLKDALNEKMKNKKHKRTAITKDTIEKMKEKDIEIRKEKRRVQKILRSEVENSKLSREIKDVLNREMQTFKNEMEKVYEQLFEQHLEKLKSDGFFYKSLYKELDIADIASYGIKNLSLEGWHFCYEHEGKALFRKLLTGSAKK